MSDYIAMLLVLVLGLLALLLFVLRRMAQERPSLALLPFLLKNLTALYSVAITALSVPELRTKLHAEIVRLAASINASALLDYYNVDEIIDAILIALGAKLRHVNEVEAQYLHPVLNDAIAQAEAIYE